MSILSQPSARRGDASTTLVLVIVCAGVVLASLDLFIVNVALPDMARDLGTHGLSGLSWVLDAYAIVYAALLVLFGRLAESRRRDRGFLLGVAIFTLSSAACGASVDLPMLIAFRVVQAAGAALLTPTSLSLVLATSAPEKRHGAVRAWTAVGGLAAALGPVVGGLLVAANWRWVFLVNVPIGLVALFVGMRRLPAVPGHPVPRPDLLGAALLTAGVGALTLGLVQGSQWGWGAPGTVLALALGAAMLMGFALHCARGHNPLVDPKLFKARAFTGASAVALLFSMAFGAMLLSRVLWSQEVWHWSALTTGLSIAPGPLMVPLFSFLVAGRMTARLGAGTTIAIGSTVFAAGIVWWSLAIGLRPDYVGDMLGGMLLTGVGVGLTLPTLMATGAGSLPPHSFATGAAVVNMLRQVGIAVGVAALVAVLGGEGAPANAVHIFRDAGLMIAGFAVLSALAGAVLLGLRPALGAAAREKAATRAASDPSPAISHVGEERDPAEVAVSS